jgi:tetratricopeptide (TPR) repeat protein
MLSLKRSLRRLLRAVAWRLTAIHGGRRALSIESLAVAMAAVIAGRAAVSTSIGDVLVGSGLVCEQHRRVDCAVALYTEAGRRDRSDQRTFTRLARVRIEEADSAAGASRRDELFQDAADQLKRAFSADPFAYHHARNRGSLERRWAQRLPPLDRARHLEEAERWYAAATALAPSSPALWAEWANLKLERRLPDDALPRLERSAALGGGDEVSTLCDFLLRVIGIDVVRSDGLARPLLRFGSAATRCSPIDTLYARLPRTPLFADVASWCIRAYCDEPFAAGFRLSSEMKRSDIEPAARSRQNSSSSGHFSTTKVG